MARKSVKVNVNVMAEVRLTESGIRVYENYYGRLGMSPPRKGYTHLLRTELWELMNIFGPKMHMTAEPVFKCNKIKILLDT